MNMKVGFLNRRKKMSLNAYLRLLQKPSSSITRTRIRVTDLGRREMLEIEVEYKQLACYGKLLDSLSMR